VSRIAIHRTHANTSYTSSQCGKHSRCSVRVFPNLSNVCHSPDCRSSRRNAMQVLSTHAPSLVFWLTRLPFREQGFLPVIYTWLKTPRQYPSLQLPFESEEDSLISNKPNSSPQPLRGWKILLLWIPAACDLTGTTVSLLYTATIFSSSSVMLTILWQLVDERWFAVHTSVHLSNDPWSPCALCRYA
jgi:hypothetical protein